MLTPQSSYRPPSSVDAGQVNDEGRVVFPPWRSAADAPDGALPAPLAPEDRVGLAVVGLGRLALAEILPALAQCQAARLTSLVSGSSAKLTTTARQYGVVQTACHAYDEFERIADDPATEAVFVALPNAMHREFVERAAAIGKPILCEKPMATSLANAEAMQAACARAGVPLMIAYRIHFEPYHRRLRDIIALGRFGRLVGMNLVNVQTVAADGERQWRHHHAMSGGGSLPDIGLYLVNTAQYLLGAEIEEVWATSYTPPRDDRFAEVEKTMAFTLRFAGGVLAQCLTSYGAREDKYARLNFERATIEITNAYSYRGQRMTISMREGDHVTQNEVILPPVNQFTAEIDHFARALRLGGPFSTPAAMGVHDHAVMEALYESARNHRPVRPHYPARQFTETA